MRAGASGPCAPTVPAQPGRALGCTKKGIGPPPAHARTVPAGCDNQPSGAGSRRPLARREMHAPAAVGAADYQRTALLAVSRQPFGETRDRPHLRSGAPCGEVALECLKGSDVVDSTQPIAELGQRKLSIIGREGVEPRKGSLDSVAGAHAIPIRNDRDRVERPGDDGGLMRVRLRCLDGVRGRRASTTPTSARSRRSSCARDAGSRPSP